ncbi:MAG: HAMP domain-containing sensor histidine kinase [Acutalibacteraceae bacterium]|nr:HAMP domain-containing sensor histidine kinase [Acutalibacteraceae bacterium]
MKNYIRVIIIVCIIFAIGMLGFVVVSRVNFSNYSENDVDVIQLNDIKETAKENWDNLQSMDEKDFEEAFVVLDNGSNILYSSDSVTEDTNMTVETAIKCRYPYSYIIIDNRVVGCVIMLDSSEDTYISIQNRMFLAAVIFGLSILLGALLLGIYINKNIVIPFRKMKHFAVRVAEGKLDEPLMTEKNNMFGVFSESFDIMREELARTKKREQELQRKEKELVASLSHDLKTPITGIKLSAELLKAKLEMSDTDNLDRIAENIYKKADQMNLLVSDLFTYTLEDLSEFTVNCQDEESSVLNDIIKKNDDKGCIAQRDIPGVLINTDVKRLEQVIGNIIANSFKYANTAIDVNYRIIEGYLEMQIRDYGPGVPSEELPLITNKFYRAKEVVNTKKEGSGLGLYISKTLMEKMNGEMMCKNEADGFSVILLILLS